MARDLKEVALLSKDPETDAFLTEFQRESDRAAAVLGATMLDELLKELLSARLVSKRLADKLLGRMMPLSTFSSRITIAEAIGLISADEAKDLHCLRDIRNDFAHGLHGLSFEDQSVKDRCANLHGPKHTFAAERNKRFLEVYPKTTRALFNLAVAMSMVQLRTRIDASARLKAATYPTVGAA
jgi:DNA-binding MltR family transcriptional regulator